MNSGIEGRLISGRYRVGPVIGSGAMSIVHAAEDMRLSRQVALKFVRHEDTGIWTERLFREAKAAARANHPAVVTVFGFGSDPDTGLDYVVMERLLGEDLAARLSREVRLPPQVVARLGVDLADALAHVHEAGVIHRDLKPANVFLAQRGLRKDELKLLDFGIARQLDMQTLTATGQIVGTIAYMAPEQLLDPKRVDARSDLYAAGVVMFECLSGQLPYAERNLPLLANRIVRAGGVDVSVLYGQAPTELLEIVGQCLRREPSDRFHTARALCDALLRITGG